MNAALRVTLADVGARRRAELARTSPAQAPAPVVAPAVAPKPTLSPAAALDARRTALTTKVARIQGDLRGAKGKAREALVAEMQTTQAALTAVNAERRALSGTTGALDVPLRLVTALLAILDRAQDQGFVRDDAEHATMDAAAGWLGANGRGER